MSIETSKIIIDDNLKLDVNTGVIGSADSESITSIPVFPTDEIMTQLDLIEDAVADLESSFDSHSISRFSKTGREGIYHKAGLLTNIVIGVILAMIVIILIV